ncbi:MAG: hypothetical protein GY938_18635, partial [Ketobacter sp.]|nr:hypothetical protein [Ketobacter sp.]
IDYGPCAFMDHYEANKVFSSIDRNGRYAYQNQPFIAHWNMAGLAQTLIPLIDGDADKAIELAQEAVNRFPGLYTEYYTNRFREKLGLYTVDADDPTLIQALLSSMEEYHADFTLVFRSLSNETCDNLESQFSNPQAIEPWIEQWQERQQQESLPEAERQQLMRQRNPAYIPRNHRIEEAIQEAVSNNNYKLFNNLHTILKNPFAAQPEHLAYRNPPLPEEAVTQTFCGT